MFGGSLILNRPYTYSIARDGVIKEVEEAIEDDCNCIYSKMKRWVWQLVGSRSFSADVGMALYDVYEYLFDAMVLAENAYAGDNKRIIFPDGESYKITKGMKPMKILHKLVEKYGNEDVENDYENFRNWHSQLLNQIHLDGVLSLSIHPLDYITMSDNGGSWSSCMHWQSGETENDPGDYRMGTVECLNSPYIIVAYLHNPKKVMDIHNYWVTEDDWAWNKKKWRELFIVQDGIITEIKGYPFQDENLTNTALMWIKDLAQINLGWTYEDIEVNAKDELIRDNKHYLFNFRPTSYMYNDFGTLKIHRARINLDKLYDHAKMRKPMGFYLTEYDLSSPNEVNSLIEIPYGGRATCMCCGEDIPYYDNKSNMVFCSNCEPSKVCPMCGEYFDGEGYTISTFEDPICESCFDYDCSMDQISECREADSTLIDLYLSLGEDKNGQPVFYDNTITTLHPDYFSYDYERLFNAPPKIYRPTFGSNHFYVTLDMVKDMDWFEDLFDLVDSYDELLVQYGLVSNDESSV